MISLNSLTSQMSVMQSDLSALARKYWSQSTQYPSAESFWVIEHEPTLFMQTVLSMLALNKASQSEQNPSVVRIYMAEHESLSFMQVI